MCHGSVVTFALRHLTGPVCRDKRILEVGSRILSGSLRKSLEALMPGEYIGVDILPGKGVDQVVAGGDLVKTFGKNTVDIVVCTELLEHAENWSIVVSNIKRVCAPGGLILVSARSPGFAYHRCPEDYWRFTVDDFKYIFSDLIPIDIRPDPFTPGVFCFAQKPSDFKMLRLSSFTVAKIRPVHRKDSR